MPFEETEAEESSNSLSDVSSLYNDFSRMQFESSSSQKEVTDDDVDLQIWNEIEPESDAEFQEDREIVEEVMLASKDETINSIDCYPAHRQQRK